MMDVWSAICMACYAVVVCIGIVSLKKSKIPALQWTVIAINTFCIAIYIAQCLVSDMPLTNTWHFAAMEVAVTVLFGWCWL